MRTKYQPGFGVLALDWQNAGNWDSVPTNAGVVVVEVWTPALAFHEAIKPQVRVEAGFQLWAHRDITGWHRVLWNGDLKPIAEMPKVRRWAHFSTSLYWTETVALDGWDE